VHIEVTGAPAGTLHLAGAVPELGAWRADEALPATKGDALALDLPRGRLYAMKLLVRTADGQSHWEAGPNRYLFVDGPVHLTYRWGA